MSGGATNQYGPIRPARRDGSERFRSQGRALNLSIVDYWRWADSDLLSNTARAVTAEFIVASASGARPRPTDKGEGTLSRNVNT
jgi:hypothetical protein